MIGQARNFVQRMTDVEHGDIQFGLQALKVGQYFAFALVVQCGQGLVHQQQLRAGEQGPGDTDPLAFAAGQVVRRPRQQVGDAQ